MDASAQMAEFKELSRALELAAGRRVNIWTDSKYAFSIFHAHETIWKERYLLTAQGSLIKYTQEILFSLDATQLPKEVSVLHCRAHQRGDSQIHVGNRLADKSAREVARQGILALIAEKSVSLPEVSPRCSQI